ncbi:hypothetical protein DERP_011863 [Dermatophagoides pteronyssinus]|uniref:Uncharacterized protein n=1 Tax=Dermatophagoides pteronyssinus TaxID=6956 RepID=A0ABQ8JR92_DERPT|nr:hypothetical protein DERP_011863 [Dermatophagoides pteronyssinus]
MSRRIDQTIVQSLDSFFIIWLFYLYLSAKHDDVKRPANDDGTECSSLPAHAHAAAAAAAASYDAAAYAGCKPFIVAERNVDA